MMIRTVILCLTGLSLVTVFQNCGSNNSSTPSASSADESSVAATGLNSCAIVGGQGAQLFTGNNLSSSECQTQCQTFIGTHPNLSCLFGTTDLAPVESCVITGGMGASLANSTNTRGSCSNQCLALQGTHPNLDCQWNGVDITPTATCSIIGGQGA